MDSLFLKTWGITSLDFLTEERWGLHDMNQTVDVRCGVCFGVPAMVLVGHMNNTEGLARAELRTLQSQVVRRLLLTALLQEYPAFPAEAWSIPERITHGAPVVNGPMPLQISFSHRGSWVAVAFSACAAVGVDIETLPKILKPAAWNLFLHPEERACLNALPAQQATDVALSLWCLKEAWLKAAQAVDSVNMTDLLFKARSNCFAVQGEIQTAWASAMGVLGDEAVLALVVRQEKSQFK